MMSYLYILLLIFLTTVASAAAATQPAYKATDLILLNCGESRSSIDGSNRSWEGDVGSRYVPWNADNISSSSPASHMRPSVSPVPYKTARVIRSFFTYSIPVSPGRKFIRLYFNPDVYSTFNTSHSYFSLTANRAFTLLSNFSASLNSKNTSQPSFMKEFVVSVGGNQRLDLTFSPNSNSFAFVNGIEIVSMPDNLYFQGVPILFENKLFDLPNDTALETLYRLNVGGAAVDIRNDSGMFRRWSPDADYIYGTGYGDTAHLEEVQVKYSDGTPPYTAPPIVYTSARVTVNISITLEWLFPVDSGFYYLLRLHYCEFTPYVRKVNQRVFTVNINNETVSTNDIIAMVGAADIPVFRDNIAWVANDGRRGKKDLRLSLYPDTQSRPQYYSVILNGLEMFKLSDESGSLAAANPEFKVGSSPQPSSPRIKEKSGGSSVVIGCVVGGVAVAAALICLIQRMWWRRVKVSKSSSVSLHSELCRCFSIKEIKTTTANFDKKFVIGRGGFGEVYKGLIDNTATSVAIKRLNPSSNQGAREFLTEIEMLSKLRHLHLVSLIGYCDDGGEMILVYDYLPHGTLRDHLYNTNNPPLNWKQRLQICLGAAKGLDYLHTGAKTTIIHRDVKTTNILLDENWIAKVSDFGLSKVGPAAGLLSHVSTVVKGSFGYVDPEYYRRQQLTNKSDVYSFGVVLFEVLCARPVAIPSLPREQVSLAEWGKLCFRKGKIEQIVDPNLKSQIAPECLSKFAETAVACLRDNGVDRPTMNEVVWSLELAMKLQVSAEIGAVDGDADGDGDNDAFAAVSPSVALMGSGGASNATDGEFFSRSSGNSASKSSDFSSSCEKLKSGDVFSEIENPLGR